MRITEFLEANGAKVWTKGEFARDSEGRGCGFEKACAVCFCSSGLLHRFYPGDEIARMKFGEVIGHEFISVWNDPKERTFEDVLSAFRKAGL